MVENANFEKLSVIVLLRHKLVENVKIQMRHFWWFSNTVRYSICTWELVIGDHWLFVRIAKRYCCSGTKNPFFHIKYIFMALLKAIDLLRQGAFFGIRNPHTVFQKSIFVQIFKLKKKIYKICQSEFWAKIDDFQW